MSYHEGWLPQERIIQEIRPAASAWWNVLDLSGSTQTLAMAQRAPWRSIIVGILIAVTAGILGSDLLLGLGLIGSTLLAAVELWHRRDFLTTDRVIRQSGFLGRQLRTIKLEDVERVQYSYPRFGRAFKAGDVDVVALGGGLTFVGVAEPEALAQRILDTRQALLARKHKS